MPYKNNDWDSLRDKIIGLGESSIQKSYYPELQKRLGELERFRALLDQSNDPIFLLKIPSGRFTDVTKSASEQLGYSHERMLEMSLEDLVTQDEMMRIQLIFNEFAENRESAAKKTFLSVFNTFDGHKIPVEISASVVNFSNELYIVMVVRDITERKKAGKALQESEQRLTDIIDFLPDATFAIDHDGRVIAWNRAIEEMTGTKKEDIIGKGDYAYSIPWYNERRPVLIDLIGKDDSEYISKYKYVHKDGKTIYAEVFIPTVYEGRGAYLWVTASPLLDSKGQQYGAIESVRDITSRKKAEDSLKKSESLYRTIFENTGAATLIYDKEGIISMINSEMELLSGFSRKEVEGRMNWSEFVHPEDLQMMMHYHQQRELDTNSAPSKYETRFINRKGKIMYTQITVDKIPGVEEYITSVVDITKQKTQHKDLKWELEVNQALNNLYLPLVSLQTSLEDISATILSESLKLTESSIGFVGEIVPNTQDMVFLSVIPPIPHNEYRKPILKLKEEGIYEGLMGHSLNIKQGFFTNNAPSHPTYIDSHGLKVEKFLSVPVILKGELVGQISISNSTRDYTEKDLEAILRLTQFYTMALQKVRDEKEIKNSLAEKEVLLREIHHRVKNNMQIISSLLNLQIQYEDLDETVGVLKESQGRVKSMAIIHEKLYQSSNLTYINFKEYVEKLIFDIFYSYGITTSAIESVLDIEDIHLNIDTAIPLGLIINELITNCVKYAFPKSEGTIFIKLKSLPEQMELIIADDGMGIPKDIDLENSKTLGLQLVNNLVNQLDGELKLNRNEGTEFKITFKELKYKKRI